VKRSAVSLLILVSLLFGAHGAAYEIRTHEKLSEVAAKNSILQSDPAVMRSLGLPSSIEDNNNPLPNSDGEPKSVLDLIKDGSRFEDGKYPISIKPLFHFFDPLHDDGLFLFTSPTWALEDKGKIHVLQNYSYGDARNFLYKALTASNEEDRKIYFGRTFESLGHVIHHIQDMAQPQHVRLDSHLNFNLTENELLIERRSRYELYTEGKATGAIPGSLTYEGYPRVTFNTARKFWHTESKNPKDGQGLAEFTNINFLSAGTNFTLDANGQPVVNARYGLPEWNGTTDEVTLWKLLQEEGINCAPTPPPSPPPSPPPPPPPGNGGVPPVSLRGISNPTFAVSAIAPALVPALTQTAAMVASTAPPACELNGTIVFYGTTVTDNYLGTPPVNNPRASTLSLFDQDLKAYDKEAKYRIENGQVIAVKNVFTLNRFNFQAAYPHLIPKAVAYSAGLIDYFFRGRLEAEDVTFTDTGITLRVKNAIDVKKYPQWDKEVLYDSGGTLVISYRYKLNGQERVGVSNTVPFSERLAPGQTSQSIYSFAVSLPSNATDVRYRLVFRGKLGAENNAVAVGPIKPMAGFAFYPSYLPTDGIGGSRVIYKTGGSWRLSTETGRAGNIDWKGWYVNGKPTKVLSWHGPRARSFPNPPRPPQPDPFQETIYQNGERWSVAPGPVLGAALTRDSAGREWIIAICKEGLADVVYRRPNTKSDSNTLHDAVAAPGGWQLLTSFPPDSSLMLGADVPWFFNGSGNEAQTMRRGYKDLGPQIGVSFWLYRLKIVILDAGATLTNEDNLPGFIQNQVDTETCSENSKADPESVCTGNCGGVKSSEYSRQSTHTDTAVTDGSFIVGVDYRGDVPVFATMSLDDRTVLKYINIYDQKSHVACGRNDWGIEYCPGDPRTKSVTYHEISAELKFNSIVKLHISDNDSVALYSHQGSRYLVETSGSRDLSTESQPLKVTGQTTYVTETNKLQYLDLRHGMYAIYGETIAEEIAGDGKLGGDFTYLFVPTRTTARTGQSIRFRGQMIRVNDNDPITKESGFSLPRYTWGSNVDRHLQCGETKSNVFGPYMTVYEYPTIVGDEKSSWAIDGGDNLFASQRIIERIIDGNGVFRGTFNFLTGGDLKQIIPPAPEGALYDVGLIH